MPASTGVRETSRRIPAQRPITSRMIRQRLLRGSADERMCSGECYFSITTSHGPSAWMKNTASSLPSTFAVWGIFLVRAK